MNNNLHVVFASTLLAVITSFFVSLIILATERWHGAHSLDNDLHAQQKFHETPVPRIGGLSLTIGILSVVIWFSDQVETEFALVCGQLLLAAMPAFLAGLSEDLTKKISVTTRLLATFASPLLACWLLDATLPRLDLVGIDIALSILPFALILTAFAVAGVANAMNIIDGFNGLAGATAVILLACMAFLAWEANDLLLTQLAMTGVGVAIGFLLVNYPTGRLFMGDCGAYLLGFWIAEIAVLMVIRHPTVTPWQLLAICAYPIIEVIYSIYRKKIIRKSNPGMPDRLHFHMLVFRRFVCRFIPVESTPPWLRNAMTTCSLIVFIAPFALLSTFWADTMPRAIGLLIFQVFFYMSLYARLVRGHWCLNPAVVLGLRPEHSRSKPT